MSTCNALCRGELILIRDRLDRLYYARESGDAGRLARVEPKLSAFLRRHYPGRVFDYLGFAWTVDDSTPKGQVRVVALDELD